MFMISKTCFLLQMASLCSTKEIRFVVLVNVNLLKSIKTLHQNVTAALQKEHVGTMKTKAWGKQNMHYK